MAWTVQETLVAPSRGDSGWCPLELLVYGKISKGHQHDFPRLDVTEVTWGRPMRPFDSWLASVEGAEKMRGREERVARMHPWILNLAAPWLDWTCPSVDGYGSPLGPSPPQALPHSPRCP
jgi:hypothetical protein